MSLIPYAAWVLVLRGLVGAWPQGDAHGRLSAVPFAGLARSWDQWGPAVTISFVLIAVPAIAALALGRDRHLKALVGAHLLLAASFGPAVWPSSGFERLLLPLSVLSLLALVDRRPARETGSVHGQVARRRNDRLALAASR